MPLSRGGLLGHRGGLLGGRRSGAERIRQRAWPARDRLGRARAGRRGWAVGRLTPGQRRCLHRVRARLRGPLVLSHHRRGVDGWRGRVRARGQRLLSQRTDDRPVPISQRTPRGHGQLVRLVSAQRGGSGSEFGVRAQVPLTDLDDVVTFLAQAARDGPVTTHRDVHDEHPDAEVLHISHDLGQILFGADQQRVTDRVVAGQRGQIAADLALHPFAAAGPQPAQPQLQSGKISERVVFRGPAAFHRGLIPVAAEQREAGPFPGDAAEKLEQACVIPGYGLSVAGSVDGHRAIRQHVARVHEQRAPVHATPSFPRRETLPAPSRQCDGSRAGRGHPRGEVRSRQKRPRRLLMARHSLPPCDFLFSGVPGSSGVPSWTKRSGVAMTSRPSHGG